MATSPTSVGRYQVIRRLGAGGMGSVFLARDPDLDRHVAIKLVKDDLTDDPELRERFSREARSAARLRHPNIVTVFDIGEQDGCPFIAMEFLEGESLADRIKRRAHTDLSQALRWMESLCLGLAHAHKAGIVHRDIKPANTMIDTEGTLKIVDFGIVRLAGSQMTREGVLVGTINYLAPEQVLGRASDHRADIFAVGAVFYELLTGHKAFPGSIPDGLFTRLCQQDPPPLASYRQDLDPAIQEIVTRALAKDPDARYPDLTTMAQDLAIVRARVSSPPDVEATRLAASPGVSSGMSSSTAPMSESQMPPASDGPGTRPRPDDDEAQRLARLRADEEALRQRLRIEEEERQVRLRAEEEARRARLRLEEEERQARLRVEEDARQARLQAEHDRLERVRTAMEHARASLGRDAFEEAISLAEQTLSMEPGLTEAHRIITQARAGLEERRRQAAIAAARRVIEAARAAVDGGDLAGAAELLDAVMLPSDALDADLADVRRRIADQQRQRQRRVDIFTDAAELALAQRDFTKAASLVADAARIDPQAPAVRTLQEQIDAHEAEQAAAARLQQAVDAALRAAHDALARADFAAARRHAAEAQRLDPGNWNVSSVLGRIDQAARKADETVQLHAFAVAKARRQRSWVGLLGVLVVVVVLAIVVARC